MTVHARADAQYSIDTHGATTLLQASGVWTATTVGKADRQLGEIGSGGAGRALVIDLSEVSRIDTAGAWILTRLATDWRKAGGEADIRNLPPTLDPSLLETIAHDRSPPPAPPRGPLPLRVLEGLGRYAFAFRDDALLSLDMIGAAIRGPQLKSGRKGSIRPISIVHHLDAMGIQAVPIVALMSFLIGAIIAQQGAWSLRYFGAEFLTVDFVSILLLREVGVLLTAIMVAGRSGSAMTAEIGSMKMREEVDALKVIGLNPVGVLVFPRLVALTIALPLLTFVADMSALIGASLLLTLYSDISPATFILKLRDAIDLSTVFAGLIKAPFMALIIGLMAAVEGMKVEGSAESLGRHVTSAVVKAIFFVIVVDGFFAVFYAQIDY